MDLAYANKALRQTCEAIAKARSELGDAAAEALFKRLADLDAIDAVWPPLPWLPTHERDNDVLALEFCPGNFLLVAPNQRRVARDASGTVDWTRVERIKIVGIEQE